MVCLGGRAAASYLNARMPIPHYSAAPASCLCTLTPGVLGPQYFKDMVSLLSSGTPDPAKMKETMLRYGLVPAPPS